MGFSFLKVVIFAIKNTAVLKWQRMRHKPAPFYGALDAKAFKAVIDKEKEGKKDK